MCNLGRCVLALSDRAVGCPRGSSMHACAGGCDRLAVGAEGGSCTSQWPRGHHGPRSAGRSNVAKVVRVLTRRFLFLQPGKLGEGRALGSALRCVHGGAGLPECFPHACGAVYSGFLWTVAVELSNPGCGVVQGLSSDAVSAWAQERRRRGAGGSQGRKHMPGNECTCEVSESIAVEHRSELQSWPDSHESPL